MRSRLTTLAISGEAHRDGRGYHGGCTDVMYTGSKLAVAGFVRFIAGLAGATSATPRRDDRREHGCPDEAVHHEW
jgi:hypothetical protein